MRTIFKNIFIKLIVIILCSLNIVSAAVFTVTTVSDTYPNGHVGELRWAIKQCNSLGGTNTINFNIPGKGPFIIKPARDLDAITSKVTINGYSQPKAFANTLANGNNAKILIVLNGNNYTTGNAYAGTGNGLTFSHGSQGSVVTGLVINGWINTGIFINSANNISIIGNFIGTNPQGTGEYANQAGIFVESATGTVIGTPNLADRNLIAGSFFYFNESACIEISQANNTTIQNNYIGTDKTGTLALGNSLAGVECISCSNVTIGGVSPMARNLISGHALIALSLIAVTKSLVQNNYIGTDITGSVALANGNMGVSISGGGFKNSSSGNTVSNNLISAHNIGIKLGYADGVGTNQNIVQGNYIGTDATGTAALPNNYGIVVNDGSNTIGGTIPSAANVISGNTSGALILYGALAMHNAIRGNYIGVNADNTGDLLNGFGIQIGLAGGLVFGSNTVQNNIFGGSNTTTTLCA